MRSQVAGRAAGRDGHTRQRPAELTREPRCGGRQPCPLPLRLVAPGAGGCRARVPSHPPAARQLAATQPWRPCDATANSRRPARRPGAAESDGGRCPLTPDPPSRMSDQAVIPSPGQARPYARTSGACKCIAALGPDGQTLASPGEPGVARRVPDRGDDLARR